MELGGWRTRSVFARYNVTSESDLADAVERVSRYVTERAAERPELRAPNRQGIEPRHVRATRPMVSGWICAPSKMGSLSNWA